MRGELANEGLGGRRYPRRSHPQPPVARAGDHLRRPPCDRGAARRAAEVSEVLDSTGNAEVAQAAKAAGVPVKKVSQARVGELARGGYTGGGGAGWALPYVDLEDLLAASDPLVVVLDGVTDPHNLGAVLRVAEGAGASGVVIPKDRAAGVTAAAVKASAGASEHVPVARVTNIRRAIDRMKEAGLWVYAAEAGGTPYTELDLTGPVGLVLGSEGKGVRRLVREG